VIVGSVQTTGGVQTTESSPGLHTTFWQFVALRWESGEPLRLSVNGRLDAPSAADPGKAGTIRGVTTLRLGSWDGLIDDFRIYGRALSDEEIGILFRAGADETPPRVLGLELEPTGGDPKKVYVTDSPPAFFYGPSASGDLEVRVAASDDGSGLESVRFPAVFGATDGATIPLQGQKGPEILSHRYSIRSGRAVDGLFETVVLDRFGNETRGPAFRVSRDALAPTASLTVPDVAFGSILVSFSGDDAGGAGTRSFDVEVKEVGAAAWTAWLSETTSRQGRYRGVPERSYLFRARATDRVGNAGPWVEGGPVELREVQLRKYYSLGSMRIAVRRDDELFYIQGDHLGSTSLVFDEAGAVVSETRYLPYGEVLWESGQSPTDFGFTGQRLEAGFGLMDYRARFYSPRLGRFVSPDTLVPDPTGSNAFNRYSYVYNNPLRYTDPSGNICVPCVIVVVALAATAVEFLSNPDIANSMTPEEDRAYTGPRDNPDYGREICSWCVDAQQGDYGAAATNLAVDVVPVGKLLPSGSTLLGAIDDAAESLPSRSLTPNTELPAASLGKNRTSEDRFNHFGYSPATTAELKRDCEFCLNPPPESFGYGIHGVSVINKGPGYLHRGYAARSEIEGAGFTLHKTGPQDHYTVELPNPVTDEVTERFNEVFRKKGR
jgi:RHS repeat-associated protein